MKLTSMDTERLTADFSAELGEEVGAMLEAMVDMFSESAESMKTIQEIEELADRIFTPDSTVKKSDGLGKVIYSLVLGRFAKVLKIEEKELATGTEEEFEHTNDWTVAMSIAIDHLKEDKAYYTKLKAAGL